MSDAQNIGYGILDASTEKVVAGDATFMAWLGARSLDELLPEFDGRTLDRATMRINPSNADAASATVELLPLIGRENWQLVRIEIVHTTQSHDEYRDAVTDLPDRRALEPHRLEWQRKNRGPVPHAVLFLDLDGFKRINDEHGHAIGDKVLAVLADRWRKVLRGHDLIVRYGGDEFVALVLGIRNAHDAEPIIKRLRNATRAAIEPDGLALRVDVTIGVALAETTAVPLQELVDKADQAMYAAKHRT